MVKELAQSTLPTPVPKLSNRLPLSPGARSSPSNRRNSVPGQPSGSQVSRGSNKDPDPSREAE
jgi:hypothetical protein